MEAVRIITIILAAYDMVLVPVVIFSRTQANRIWIFEMLFSIGIDLLLLARIFTAAENLHKPIDKDAIVALIAVSLITFVTYSIVQREEHERK